MTSRTTSASKAVVMQVNLARSLCLKVDQTNLSKATNTLGDAEF